MIAGRLNPIPYLASLFFFIGSPIVLGGSPPNCESLLSRLAEEKAQSGQAHPEIDSWEGLLRAFSEGLYPTLPNLIKFKPSKYTSKQSLVDWVCIISEFRNSKVR